MPYGECSGKILKLDKNLTEGIFMQDDKLFKGVKMSNAERRNGERVWKAIQELFTSGEMLMTVGEICEACGMSRPAVKKYLDLLIESNHVKKFAKGKKTAYYTLWSA
jgi:response regulator of citrate/malate metabolism